MVKTYCGHGISDLFHCAPSIPHYSPNKAVGIMKEGQTFTIEVRLPQHPAISLGVRSEFKVASVDAAVGVCTRCSDMRVAMGAAHDQHWYVAGRDVARRLDISDGGWLKERTV